MEGTKPSKKLSILRTDPSSSPWWVISGLCRSFHRFDPFLGCEQGRRFTRFQRASGCKRQRNGGCTHIVGYATDQHYVVLSKSEPGPFDGSTEFLDRRTHDLQSVLRFLDKCRPCIRSVCGLIQIVRHKQFLSGC